MSRSGSSAARSSSWAQMVFAMVSSTALPRKMIRSLSSRLKTWSSRPLLLGIRLVMTPVPMLWGTTSPESLTAAAFLRWSVGDPNPVLGRGNPPLTRLRPGRKRAGTPVASARVGMSCAQTSGRKEGGTTEGGPSALVEVVDAAVVVHVVGPAVVVGLDV